MRGEVYTSWSQIPSSSIRDPSPNLNAVPVELNVSSGPTETGVSPSTTPTLIPTSILYRVLADLESTCLVFAAPTTLLWILTAAS